MAAHRRKMLSLVPACTVMEARLALSGNFLSHGVADLARVADHLDHHRSAEHSTMQHEHEAGLDGGMKVHYHHINAK